MQEIKIDNNLKGERIDKVLTILSDFSRNKIIKMIEKEEILVNGEKVKKKYTVKENDIILIKEHKEETTLKKENIPLEIIFEDDDVIVVNKPQGMVVHPAPGNKTGTLVNALLYHSNQLSNDELRPGIVHRIDKETSGLLMVAKNDKAHNFLAKQLKEKTSTRKYIALVSGVIEPNSGTIKAPIGRDINDRKKMMVTEKNSKDATTHFKVLKRFTDATLIECKLETGRTHQIRVHMAYIEHPVINDKVYGKKKRIDDKGQLLHAKNLGFIHPTTKEYMEFEAPLPENFKYIIDNYESLK